MYFEDNKALVTCLDTSLVKIEPTDKDLHCCEVCFKTYSHKKSLKKHYLKQHPTYPFPFNRNSSSKNFTCALCSRTFSFKQNLNRHINTKHIETASLFAKNSQPKGQKCPLCNDNVPRSSMIEHFHIQHDTDIEVENLIFSSFEEFLTWKESIESETYARFVKGRSEKVSKTHSISSYICHRSGMFVPKGQQKRNIKVQGSCKINGFCPASLKVIKSMDKCQVEYIKTHVGHDCDLGHLWLSNKEREEIALKLALNMPFDEILEEMRKSIDDEGIKRLHLLTRKDLHNIVKSFNLNVKVQGYEDDFLSLMPWTKETDSEDFSFCVGNTSSDIY